MILSWWRRWAWGSPVEIQGMVDHFTVLVQPGSGDDLQGIKKGVLEFVQSLIINKSDLNKTLANQTKTQLLSALKILHGRNIPVMMTSSLGPDSVKEVFEFFTQQRISSEKRQQMEVLWFQSLLKDRFQRELHQNKQWIDSLEQLKQSIVQEETLPTEAVQSFFKKHISKPLS